MELVIQCPACRVLVTVQSVVIPPGGLRAGVACSACSVTSWIPASTSALPAPPAIAPLPRPADPPPAALSPTVGPGFSEEQRVRIGERLAKLPGATPEQAALTGEFDKLLSAWNDDGAHKGLLKRASAAGELAFIGQRYRAVLEAVPGDAHAKKAQADLLGLAMSTMAVQRDIASPERGSGQRTQLVAAVVVLVALIAVGAVLLPRLLRPLDGGATMDAAPQE